MLRARCDGCTPRFVGRAQTLETLPEEGAGYPRGAVPPKQPDWLGGSLATSCHLLGALSHCLCFDRKHRFFLSVPIFSPPPPILLFLSLSLAGIMGVGGCPSV